jgi:hypothetical protein
MRNGEEKHCCHLVKTGGKIFRSPVASRVNRLILVTCNPDPGKPLRLDNNPLVAIEWDILIFARSK